MIFEFNTDFSKPKIIFFLPIQNYKIRIYIKAEGLTHDLKILTEY